jgi:hypothetical protein
MNGLDSGKYISIRRRGRKGRKGKGRERKSREEINKRLCMSDILYTISHWGDFNKRENRVEVMYEANFAIELKDSH